MNVQLGETSNPEGGQMPQLGQFTNQKEINCQLQDEANIRVCQKEKEHQETGQEIVEEVAGQDLFQLWQVNVEDELSESADACPQERSSQHGNIIPAQHGEMPVRIWEAIMIRL